MKVILIRFFQNLDQVIDLKRVYTWGMWLLSIFISLYCLILFSLPLYETAAPKGIVLAKDHDGVRAIENSIASRWYNSNHFAPYGNLYYRLSHTLADLTSLPEEKIPVLDQLEKRHDFSLKTVSLLSVVGLSFFFAFIFLGLTPETLIWTNVLLFISLRSEMWSTWVFRAHPEHLLSLALAFAFVAFGKLLVRPTDKKLFIVSALLWGIAMAVKRSTSAYIPGILILLLFPMNKSNLKKTASYIGYMLLSYFLIGFPQNFGFVKHIKFLLYESSLHQVGDFQTVLTGLSLSWNQCWMILPIFILLSFFSQKTEKYFSLKFVFLIILGALPILLRKLSYAGDHHTMPLAISAMVVFMFLVTSFNSFEIQKGKQLILMSLGILAIKFLGFPVAYTEARNEQMTCREEINQINKIISKKASPEFLIVTEAVFPTTSQNEAFTKSYWGLRWNDISNKVGFLGIKTTSIDLHVPDITPNFNGKSAENWDDKQNFYRQIKDQNVVQGPHGNFEKVFSKCGYEVWEKTEKVK